MLLPWSFQPLFALAESIYQMEERLGCKKCRLLPPGDEMFLSSPGGNGVKRIWLAGGWGHEARIAT